MIGKVIGAMVGERLARRVGGLSETNGALLGAGAAMVLRRMGPVGLAAAAIGGYALKKHFERREAAGATGDTAV
jgi:hypothetical protein